MKFKTALPSLFLLVATLAAFTWWRSGSRLQAEASAASAGAPITAQSGSVTPSAAGPASAAAPAAVATIPVEPVAAPGPFSDFARWLGAFQAAQRSGAIVPPPLLAEGQQLAAARQPVMQQLLRTNPAEALARSLKWHEWAALPVEVQALVETPFSATADYNVLSDCRPASERDTPWPGPQVVLGDEHYEAFSYGRRTGLATKIGTPLQGITLEGQAALWASPVYRLMDAEVAVAQARFPDGNARGQSWLTGEPLDGPAVTALIGGRVHYFANEAELTQVAQTIGEAEELRSPHSVSGPIASAMGGTYFDTIAFKGSAYHLSSVWTETPKRVLGLRLAYSDAPATTPYTQPQLVTDLNSASNSIREMSFTKTHLIPTVTGILVLPNNKAYYEANSDTVLANQAQAAAAAAGYVLANYDIYVYSFPALARIGGTPAFANVNGPNQWVNGNSIPSILTHEFGHNYGIVHANSWLGTSTGNGYEGHGFEHQEYGDVFDIMGNDRHTMAGGQGIYPGGHFSMHGKAALNWIEASEVHHATNNGTYRLRRFDHINSRVTAGGKLALKVLTGGGQELWVGFRRNFTNSAVGAYIVWGDTPLQHRLLDATPLSVADRTRDKEDAVLPPCGTFTDPSGTVRITTLGQGGASPNEYLDVDVTLIDKLPDYELFTAADLKTNGLVGRYVNSSLRARTAQENWRTTPGVTISGTRVDSTINFTGNGWGARAPVGITGGSDADWENFSVQWDGFVAVNRPTRLATRSDDGSRMWIDVNGDSSFAATAPEFVNNNWGTGQGATIGEKSVVLAPGIYAIRIQYEEGNGGNSCELLAFPTVAYDLFADAGFVTNGLTASFVNANLRASAAQADWRSTQPISGTRLDAYPGFLGDGWGARAPVGLTGGSDANWENYSVQWDGWLRVYEPTKLVTISDDSSRMWIDVDGNGTFASAAPEYVNNHWGTPQGATLGDWSGTLQPGAYRIRLQYEEGGGGNNMLLAGAGADTPGLDYNGLSFDGVDDHVSANLGAGLANNYTVAAWVNLRAGGTFGGTRMAVLSGPSCGSTTEVLIRSATASASDPQLLELGRCNNYEGFSSSAAIPLNRWTHVAVTVTAAKVVTYYINGQPAGGGNYAGADTTLGPVIHLGDNVSRKFNGSLDEVQIWNSALSAAQIQANVGLRLSGFEPGLVALWKFDEGFGTTARDSSPNNRHGTLVNGPGWTPSPVALPAGHALCFDGVDDSMQLASAGLNMPTNEITLEFWQRVFEPRAQATFGLDPDNSANRILAHVPYWSGIVYWDFGNITGPGRLSYIPPADIIGRWQHWAFVSSVSGGFQRIYRNGVLEASDSAAGQFARYAATLIIGGNGFKGELDEFRIWSVARTAGQIQAGLNCPLPLPQANLWAYWRCDAGGGTTVTDLSGNGRNATLVNGAQWVESSAPLTTPTGAPVTTVVTTVADDGPGSLRQALLNAAYCAGPDTITFAPGLSGQTIRLTSAQLDIADPTGPVVITAANLPAGIALSGEGARRVFRLAANSSLTLDSLTVSNGFLNGSSIEAGDGAGILSYGNLTVQNCTITGNRARFAGGVDSEPGSSLTLLQSTLSHNTATSAAGGLWAEGTHDIRHVTVVSNSAVGAGGGMRLFGTSTLSHSLVAANTGGSDPDVSKASGSFALGSFNLVGNGTGSGLTNGVNGNQVGIAGSPINPLLGPLQNNGGRTRTFRPLLGSPALDTGDPGIAGAPVTDQRGYARISGGRIDIGSVESIGIVASTPVSLTRCVGDSATFSTTVTAGEAPITYQWAKDGVAIAGATTSSYTKAGVAVTNAGDYCVTITSASYSASRCAWLGVPTVTLAPLLSQLVCTGDVVRFDAGLIAGGVAKVYSNNFNAGAGPGLTVSGNTTVDGGYLKLTTSTPAQNGRAVLDDFTGGRPVTAFTATFKASIFGGAIPLADGFSFNLAPTPAPGFIGGLGEEGTTTGLAVSFDTYNNGGGEAPAVDVKWNGALIGRTMFQASQNPGVTDPLVAQRNVRIQLYLNGTVDVVYGTNVLFNHLPTPYVPITGAQWVMGARTGGASDSHWIDDLRIEVPPPYGAPVTFAWRKNGVAIPGQTNDSLVLPSAALADAGTYSVVAASTCNTLTNSATLDVATLAPVVTTINDSGPGSLRQAILNINECGGPGVVTFAVTGTIRRAVSDVYFPTITASISLLGPGTNLLTISGQATNGGLGGLFSTAAGTTNLIRGLRLADGAIGNNASALVNRGVTTLEDCRIENFRGVVGYGGAVHNEPSGILAATNCVFVNNSASGGNAAHQTAASNGGPGGGGAGMGGAVFSEGPSLTLSGCQFVNNRAQGGNGGNGDRNAGGSQAGLAGGGPNAGNGGTVGNPGGPGGFGGGGGGGAGSSFEGFAGGAGGFGGGGGAGGARGGGGAGGAPGAGGLYGGAAGGSFSSHSGGGGGGAGLGGALFARNGAVTVVNCQFTGNVATNGVGGFGSFGGGIGASGQGAGGGIFNQDAKLIVLNTTFTGNQATHGSANVEASTFVTTLADSGPGSLRQAICNAEARPGPDAVTFDPSLSGGVIRLTSAQLAIGDTTGGITITATNLPAGVVVSGEGARRVFRLAASSSLTLDSLTVSNGFLNGTAIETGDGAGVISYGNLTLRRCTFAGNRARFAGAVDIEGGALTVEQSTFSGNTATQTGGAFWISGSATTAIRHSTIASNSAASSGGGLILNSVATFTHNVVAGNTGTNPDVSKSGGYAAQGFNLIGNGTGSGLTHGVNGNLVGTAGTPINARLGPLQNNGGPTPTLLPIAGSPVREAGDPLFVGLGLTDQRGFPRVAGQRVDIGAVENCLSLYLPADNGSYNVDLAGGPNANYNGIGGATTGGDHSGIPGITSSSFALNTVPGHSGEFYTVTNAAFPGDANAAFGLKGDFTISVWVNPGNVSGYKWVLGNDGPGGPGTLGLGFYEGRAFFSFWASDLPGNRLVPVGQWTHLAVTYKQHGGQLALYVNGQLDASVVGRTNTLNAHNLLIGGLGTPAGTQFEGYIDDVAVFCATLPANQIAALALPATRANTLLPGEVFSPALAASDACAWSVREIYHHTNNPVLMPYDLPSALYMASTPGVGEVTNYFTRDLNRYDPDTNPGASGYFGGDAPFRSDNLTPRGLINTDDDYFVLAAVTKIQIGVEDDYTFGFATDDGAQLRIKGARFTSSTSPFVGNPAVPAHSGDTLAFPANTANSVTLGVTHLLPGNYEVEFITWELGGGAFCEVFAARGARTTWDGSFKLLSPTLFATHPLLTLEQVGAQVRVSWTSGNACDRLQAAPAVTGPWTDVPGAASGQLFPASSAMQFFRVAQ